MCISNELLGDPRGAKKWAVKYWVILEEQKCKEVLASLEQVLSAGNIKS